jgi:hypothetical protein
MVKGDGLCSSKPEFRGISLIVESPTTQSKLDGSISTKFHICLLPLTCSINARKRAAVDQFELCYRQGDLSSLTTVLHGRSSNLPAKDLCEMTLVGEASRDARITDAELWIPKVSLCTFDSALQDMTY